jgi:hypothetical protein
MLDIVRDEGRVDVELVLECVECQTRSIGNAFAWRALVVPGDGPEDELALYCPDCAWREFGASTP